MLLVKQKSWLVRVFLLFWRLGAFRFWPILLTFRFRAGILIWLAIRSFWFLASGFGRPLPGFDSRSFLLKPSKWPLIIFFWEWPPLLLDHYFNNKTENYFPKILVAIANPMFLCFGVTLWGPISYWNWCLGLGCCACLIVKWKVLKQSFIVAFKNFDQETTCS